MFCFVNIAAFSFAQTSNTLPATGNVGVGTLTPTTKLEVVGNTALKGAVTVRDSVTIQKRLTVNQNIKVTGKSVFVNKAKFKNNINVFGKTKLKNSLVVDSLARFKSKLVVDGLTKMKGNAIVLGNLKLPNLSTTNNPALFLTSNANGKVGSLNKAGLTTIIYQPPQTCRTDQNGNILSVWKQNPNPNYGILYTGTDCPTRVGIGIATPIATLDVNGNGYFSQTLEVGSNATPITFPTQVKINAINRQAGLLLINRPIATSSIPLYGIKNIVNTTTINAYSVTQESTNQDVFVVKGDGSVGIGTNSPSQKLEIAHDDLNGGISLNRLSATTSKSEIKFSQNGVQKWAIGNDLNINGKQNFFIWDQVSGTTRFLIDPEGTIITRVKHTVDYGYGILCLVDGQSPQNMKLTKAIGVQDNTGKDQFIVWGDGLVHAREFKVTLNSFNHPDYVFAKNYELLPIDDLNSYLKQHKHLPGVPSVKEVEKENGINLGEMTEINLKKTEELYLYVLQLHDEMQKLKKDNETLQMQINQMKK